MLDNIFSRLRAALFKRAVNADNRQQGQHTEEVGVFFLSNTNTMMTEQQERITHRAERRHQLRMLHPLCMDVEDQEEPLLQQKKATGLLLQPHETCPSCGSILVVRSGSYGEFIGCSGFPDCRFTKQGQKSRLSTVGRQSREMPFYPKLGGGQGRAFPQLGGRRKEYPKMCRAKRAKSFPKF